MRDVLKSCPVNLFQFVLVTLIYTLWDALHSNQILPSFSKQLAV